MLLLLTFLYPRNQRLPFSLIRLGRSFNTQETPRSLSPPLIVERGGDRCGTHDSTEGAFFAIAFRRSNGFFLLLLRRG